jgi:hypothetical protein
MIVGIVMAVAVSAASPPDDAPVYLECSLHTKTGAVANHNFDSESNNVWTYKIENGALFSRDKKTGEWSNSCAQTHICTMTKYTFEISWSNGVQKGVVTIYRETGQFVSDNRSDFAYVHSEGTCAKTTDPDTRPAIF